MPTYKIRIDRDGFIHRVTPSAEREQLCPHQQKNGSKAIRCGDWCPRCYVQEEITEPDMEVALGPKTKVVQPGFFTSCGSGGDEAQGRKHGPNPHDGWYTKRGKSEPGAGHKSNISSNCTSALRIACSCVIIMSGSPLNRVGIMMNRLSSSQEGLPPKASRNVNACIIRR